MAGTKAVNRQMVLTSLKFLSGQVLAIRGHNASKDNFLQLLSMRVDDEPPLIRLLHKAANCPLK